MAEMIKFYKGAVANLPSTGVNGALYITTDEGAIYLGTGSGMKRLGDFIQVDAVANLPETGANTSALYYCVAENVLAKWDGATWKQINKQPTADEIKTLIGLGNYELKSDASAKLSEAKTYTDDEVKKVSDYVGTFTHDTAKTVVEYVNAKTAGIATDTALSELTDRVTTAEGDIDNLEAAIGENGSVTNKIAAAQAAADAAQATADKKVTMADVEAKNYATKEEAQGYADAKNEAIAAAKKAGDDAQADVNTLFSKVGTVEDGKTVVGMIGDAQKAADDAQAAVDALAGKVGTPTEGKTIVEMIADAKTAATYDDTKVKEDIAANAQAIADEKERAEGIEGGLEARLKAVEDDYLKADDKEALQNQINTIMNNPDAEGAINSINEFTQYVKDHGTIADGFRTDIDKNKTDIAAEVKRAGDAESALSGRIDTLEAIDHDAYVAADATNLQAAKDYADGVVEALGIDDYVKKADADATYATIGHNHDDKYDTKGAAAQALTDAQSYADQAEADAIATAEAKVKALADGQVKTNTEAIATKAAQADLEDAVNRIGTAEGKIAGLETASATHALKTEVEAVQTAIDEYKTSNNAAVALKANAADVYAKTETYTKAEVDAAIEAAHTWGTF